MMKSETKKDLIVKEFFFFWSASLLPSSAWLLCLRWFFFSLTCWCHLTSKTAYMRFHFLYLAS